MSLFRMRKPPPHLHERYYCRHQHHRRQHSRAKIGLGATTQMSHGGGLTVRRPGVAPKPTVSCHMHIHLELRLKSHVQRTLSTPQTHPTLKGLNPKLSASRSAPTLKHAGSKGLLANNLTVKDMYQSEVTEQARSHSVRVSVGVCVCVVDISLYERDPCTLCIQKFCTLCVNVNVRVGKSRFTSPPCTQ